jgi:hypothetical protein
LKCVAEATLTLGQAPMDGEGGGVAGALKHLDVVVAEGAWLQCPHVEYADDRPLHNQWDSEQRLQPTRAQDRVGDVCG